MTDVWRRLKRYQTKGDGRLQTVKTENASDFPETKYEEPSRLFPTLKQQTIPITRSTDTKPRNKSGTLNPYDWCILYMLGSEISPKCLKKDQKRSLKAPADRSSVDRRSIIKRPLGYRKNIEILIFGCLLKIYGEKICRILRFRGDFVLSGPVRNWFIWRLWQW